MFLQQAEKSTAPLSIAVSIATQAAVIVITGRLDEEITNQKKEI